MEKEDFSWNDLSDLLHAIKNDRTVVGIAVSQLQKIDSRLEKLQDKLERLILSKD